MRREFKQQGLTSLEFAAVLAIFTILAAVLLGRLIAVEREAERLEVSLAVRSMRTGLKLAVGEFIMHGEEFRIAGLVHQNPLDFLGTPQKVGAGETASEPGEWAFSPTTRVLSYQPRQPEAFTARDSLSWRLEATTDSANRTLDLRLTELAPVAKRAAPEH